MLIIIEYESGFRNPDNTLLFVIFRSYRIREGCDEPPAGDISRTGTVAGELSGFKIGVFSFAKLADDFLPELPILHPDALSRQTSKDSTASLRERQQFWHTHQNVQETTLEQPVTALLQDKSVLITGAFGALGSAVARTVDLQTVVRSRLFVDFNDSA